MNIWDVLILVLIGTVVFFCVRTYRRSGGCCSKSCGSNCPHCNECDKKT